MTTERKDEGLQSDKQDSEARFLRRVRDTLMPPVTDQPMAERVSAALDMIGDRLIDFGNEAADHKQRGDSGLTGSGPRSAEGALTPIDFEPTQEQIAAGNEARIRFMQRMEGEAKARGGSGNTYVYDPCVMIVEIWKAMMVASPPLPPEDAAAIRARSSEASTFDIEAYIAGLKWSPQATDHEKTLVAGNLRGLFAVLREKHNAMVHAARAVGAGFQQYDELFAALERDGHIKIEGGKVSVARSASATILPKKPPCGWMPWGHLVNDWMAAHGDIANMRAADLWDRIVEMVNAPVGPRATKE